MGKQELYNKAISLLSYIEIIVQDEKQYKVLRKMILDLANEIKRLDEDGK